MMNAISPHRTGGDMMALKRVSFILTSITLAILVNDDFHCSQCGGGLSNAALALPSIAQMRYTNRVAEFVED
jgi:hypothetical protein